MLRSGIAEFKYYQAIKLHAPEVWKELGSLKYLNIPLAFLSSKGSVLLQEITNETVCKLATNYRQTGIQFLIYIVLVLALSIIYFKTA
jgi:hypothetical protein